MLLFALTLFECKPTFFLRLALLAGLHPALGFLFLTLPLERLLSLCTDAGSGKLLPRVSRPTLRIVRRQPHIRRNRRAENQLCIAPQDEVPHLIVLRLRA